MRVTIKDVAQKTGLSVSTVSLVLNHKPHRISEETKQRVLEAAKEMNYHPNQLAVGLIKKKTNTIGLIIPDITNMFFAEIAKGAEVECQKRGYSMILCNTNDSPQKDIDYVNVLLERGGYRILQMPDFFRLILRLYHQLLHGTELCHIYFKIIIDFTGITFWQRYPGLF